MRTALIILLFSSCSLYAVAQATSPVLVMADGKNAAVNITVAQPLDQLALIDAENAAVTVADGADHIYFSVKDKHAIVFTVSGAPGVHTVRIVRKKAGTHTIRFAVSPQTTIDDHGRYAGMFKLFYTSMQTDTGSVQWNGKRYRYFVPWGLDHCHTMKGLKYFYDFGDEFVDLMRQVQREDGMIYSFVQYDKNVDYFRTRDAFSGYTRKVGDKYFVRQPTENHPEYIFVKTIFQWWKASGDDAWMKQNLDAAAKALDYCVNDPARWSERFKLLKRVYTIDSWDFQVDDKYTPNIGITNTMIIDPEKSKFGVFFGDNTAYVMACRQLAEMQTYAGRPDDAAKYTRRASEIEERLNALSWNGKFFTHFIDEDPAVKRDLGVDEKSQLAQSNAYSLNRGLSHDKSKAIIESYLALKNNLPVGSPGEWYAIYPPFERGFEIHNAKWQYMNGGVGGHVAGELARGAFEHGYETYATDVLERLFEIGKKYDNKIYFAYTGSIPPAPAAPEFTPVDLTAVANMDNWDTGAKNVFSWMNSKRAGDDLRNLLVGEQRLNNIRFNVIDASKNNRRSVTAVSRQKGFPQQVTIPVNNKGAAIYFLHTSSKPSSENVSGAVAIRYADGSHITRYMMMGKQLTYWWFSQLSTDHSGIAWYGENAVSKGVGLSWCAIDNPFPEKVISDITLLSAEDETIYTVFAISLADQKHYVPVSGPSFGGPDNWAAATAMAAMIEGLAGVKDSPGTQAYAAAILSPRWNETKTDTIRACIQYAASGRYVAYTYISDVIHRKIVMQVTGSGREINCHIPLPGHAKAKNVIVDGVPVSFSLSLVEQTPYADFRIDPGVARKIEVTY